MTNETHLLDFVRALNVLVELFLRKNFIHFNTFNR